MTRRGIFVGSVWAVTAAGAAVLALVGVTTTVDAAAGSWLAIFTALGIDVLVFATVGAILALRQPGNAVGLVLLASGPLMVTTFCGFLIGAQRTEIHAPDDPLAELASLVASVTVYLTMIIVGPVLALLFPDGRLPGPRWRLPVAVIGVALVLGTIMSLARPGPLNVGLAENPFGIRGTAWVEPVSTIGAALAAFSLPAALLLALVAVLVRFRRAGRVEREQLKWFLAANAVVVTLLLLVFSNPSPESTLLDVLGVASLSLPPIAVGIAITRYRLYEIDRLISRTIGWAIVTGVLVAVFSATILGLQAILAGVAQGGTFAVAASTLLAYAVFQPLRRRVQMAVDRRFDRARYDGDRTSTAFAERLQERVDLAGLEADIAGTVSTALHPRTFDVWLRRAGR